MVRGKRSVAGALSEIERRVDNMDGLSPEDRAQIKAKAREHVAKKKRDAAEAKLLAEEIRNEELAQRVREPIERIVIDLAPFASYIALDGVFYWHGIDYNLPYSVARTIEDISARTWEHQNEIGGRRRKGDLNRRPQNRRISPSDAGVPASALNTRASLLTPETSI